MSEMQEHRGVMILIFGIVGLVLCMPLGIAAWIMGNNDLAAMAAGHMDPEGRGMTQAGKILGIVTVVLTVIGLLFFVFVVILGIGSAAMSGQ